MNFNRHFELAGLHAFLSPSSYHWINYDDEKLAKHFVTKMAAQRGSDLHDFAKEAIRLKIKMSSSKQTLNMYVNDALGFRMVPEQVLFYSPNCFGTADAIGFRLNKKTNRYMLRIHDLKTGVSPTSMKQLMVYVALFCLEYGYKPGEIDIELRIYQNDEVEVLVPELDDIVHIMGKIIAFDRQITNMKAEAFE